MIMFLGTTSGAGKTIITAIYCRYLWKNGINAAPFKASNLSSTSYLTTEGKQIGVGQAFQAFACGMEPVADMNPLLTKIDAGKMETIVNGLPFQGIADHEFRLMTVLEAYDRLSEGHEVVTEGSGSPVELNLMDDDVSNLGIASERNIPCILVGDIDQGGVFAGLYGTWSLIPEDKRHLLKGFIINRFRGDPTILKSGIERIEKLTGMRSFGVLSFADLKFPDEDVLSDGVNIDPSFMDDLDELLKMAERDLDLNGIRRISSA